MMERECMGCQARFVAGPCQIEIGEEIVDRQLAELCADCEAKRLEANCAVCVNCGKLIPPNSQVGVIPGSNGESLICHTTYECSPPGGSHYGFWGEGKLESSFRKIEQC